MENLSDKKNPTAKDMAIDFLMKNPLWNFIPGRFRSVCGVTLKKNVNINVLFSGFGSLLREMFYYISSSVQFAKEGSELPAFVQYTAVCGSEERVVAEKELSDGFYRYKSFLSGLSEEAQVNYLPVVPLFYDISFKEAEADLSAVMAETAKEIIFDKNNFLFVFIEENELDALNGVLGNGDNVVIFCRRTSQKESGLSQHERLFYYGDFSADNLSEIPDKRAIAAFIAARNILYDSSFDGFNADFIQQEVIKKAYGDVQNICACIGFVNYLASIGFAVVKDEKGSDDCDTDGEFEKAYQAEFNTVGAGKKRDSARSIIGRCEHYRWFACMINCGYVPAKISHIIYDKKASGAGFSNGKDVEKKTHGNLTDMQGLEMFSRLVAARDGEEQKDLAELDLQLTDNAVYLISAMGYKLKKRG